MKTVEIIRALTAIVGIALWCYSLYLAYNAEWPKAVFFMLLSTSTEVRMLLTKARV